MAKRRDRVVAGLSMGGGGSTAVRRITLGGSGTSTMFRAPSVTGNSSSVYDVRLEAMRAAVLRRCSLGRRNQSKPTPGLITWSIFTIRASLRKRPALMLAAVRAFC